MAGWRRLKLVHQRIDVLELGVAIRALAAFPGLGVRL
jgi:hypothetical protein